MLVVIGGLVESGYRGIDGDVPSIEDHSYTAIQTWIASGIYGFFIVISLARLIHLWWLGRHQKPTLDSFAER